MKEYLKYAEKTLGISSIMWPTLVSKDSGFIYENEKDSDSIFFTNHGPVLFEKKVPSPLIVLNLVTDQSQSLWSDSVQELFQKIMVATKILPQDWVAYDCTCIDRKTLLEQVNRNFQYQLLLIMSEDPVEMKNQPQWLETLSPFHLLSHPENKKRAWTDLQTLMKKYEERKYD